MKNKGFYATVAIIIILAISWLGLKATVIYMEHKNPRLKIQQIEMDNGVTCYIHKDGFSVAMSCIDSKN